jgi:hypothetical protein
MQLKTSEVTAMIDKRRKRIGFGHTALALLAAPATALAQVPTAPMPPAPPADHSAAGMVGVVAAFIALLVVAGITVKFYDAKRKREEQGIALQARLSDVLLLHPSLNGLPVVASVHMPLFHGSPPVVEVKGTVPDHDAHEMAIQLVQHELDGTPARLEDQIVVDPLGFKRVAA